MVCWHRWAALCAALGFVVSASAQLRIPGLPDPADLAPVVRLVESDSLVEEGQLLQRRIEGRVKARRPGIQVALDGLGNAIARLTREAEGEAADHNADKRARQLATAHQLEEALNRELDVLEQARAAVRHGLELAAAVVDPPAGPQTFDTALALERAAFLAQSQIATAQKAAEKTSWMIDTTIEATTRGDWDARITVQARRIEVAEAELAAALALEVRARSRQLGWRLEVVRDALIVTREDRSQARRAVEDARVRLAEVTAAASARVDPPEEDGAAAEASPYLGATRALGRAEQTRSDERVRSAEAGLYLAQARSAAMAVAVAPRAVLPSILDEASVRERMARLDEARVRIEEQHAGARRQLEEASAGPAVRRTTEERLVVIEESLEATDASMRDLKDSLVVARMATRLTGAGSGGLSSWILWVLTGLIVLLAFGALRFGHFVTGPTSAVGRLMARRFKNDPAGRAKAGLLASSGWFLLVGGLAADAAVRFIWEIEWSFQDLLGGMNKSLFIVDDRPVSLFSLIELVLAVVIAVSLSRIARSFLRKRIYPALVWDTGLTTAVDAAVKYTIVLAGVLVGLRFVGIGLSSLALFAGVIGIGLGFGLRSVTENFIAGFVLLAERPVKIGDFIEVGDKYEGQVRDIQARATTVVSRDNITMIIPNSQFITGQVTNWSHGDPKVRIRIPVGVAYGTDPGLVRKALIEVAEAHGKVLSKPAPEVFFWDFGNSSLDFQLLFWIDDQSNRFRIASDLRFAVEAAFRRLGIEISFQQVDLHLKSVVSEAAKALASPFQRAGDDG